MRNVVPVQFISLKIRNLVKLAMNLLNVADVY